MEDKLERFLGECAGRAAIVDRRYARPPEPIRLSDLVAQWQTEEADAPVGLPAAGPSGAAFVSDGSSVLACNARAGSLGAGPGVRLDALPLDPEDAGTLAREIRQVASGRGAVSALMRLRPLGSASVTLFQIDRVASGTGRPAALVRVTDLAWTDAFAAAVRQALGLSPSEEQALRLLCLGPDDESTARSRRGTTALREQVAALLERTACPCPADLMRLVVRLSDITRAEPGPAVLLDHGRPLPGTLATGRLSRPGGRTLAWVEWGDPSGRPVLFLHSCYGLLRWPAAAERAAAARGLRIIAPIRAGYDGTCALPPRADVVDGVADDLAALIDHLAVAPVTLLPLGDDLLFACRLACDRPDAVDAILGCGTYFPFRAPGDFDVLGDWQRLALTTARQSPRSVALLSRTILRFGQRMGKPAFLERLFRGSPGDIALLAEPEVRAAIVAGTDICLSETWSAHAALAAGVSALLRDWSDLVLACPAPIGMVVGTESAALQRGGPEALRREYPGVEIAVIPDAGQLVFFRVWPEVLARLAPGRTGAFAAS